MKNKIIQGGCLEILKTLPKESIDCVVTSPPYWALRDYGVDGQLGLEPTFLKYVNKLCNILDEVKRILKKTGTCWVNLGDTYNAGGNYRGDSTDPKQVYNRASYGRVQNDKKVQGISEKCLCQIPSRFAIEMTNRGWILRNEIIWHKPNVMPSSVKDRFTVDFEKVFLFVKSKKYYFEQQFDIAKFDGRKQEIMRGSVKYAGEVTPGKAPHTFAERAHQRWQIKNGQKVRNKRCVWSINTKPLKEAHFATFPEKLIEPMILAGCPKGGTIMDPFMGSGTTAVVAEKLGRQWIGIELNPEYIKIAEKRLRELQKPLFT